DRLALPVEVPFGHAGADIDDHEEGNPLGRQARAQIGPAWPGKGKGQKHQGGQAQDQAAPERAPAAARGGARQKRRAGQAQGAAGLMPPPPPQGRERQEEKEVPGMGEVRYQVSPAPSAAAGWVPEALWRLLRRNASTAPGAPGKHGNQMQSPRTQPCRYNSGM